MQHLRLLLIGLVALVALFAGPAPVAQGSAWATVAVDTPGDVGVFTSILVDGNGDPMISFQDDTNDDLKFAICDQSASTNGNCDQATDWTNVTVDSVGAVGLYTSVAVGGGGDPLISHWDSTNADLEVAICDISVSTNGNCDQAGDWSAVTVDSAGDVGRNTSIAVNPSGDPIVSYRYLSGGNLKFAICDRSTTSCLLTAHWSVVTVDSPGDVGVSTSIASGGSGDPMISYYDNTNDDLKFAICDMSASTNGNCDQASDWDNVTVDSGGNVGSFTSIAVDANGDPMIAYTDSTNFDVKFAVCDISLSTSGNCDQLADWSKAVVDAPGTLGNQVSVQVDGAGDPVISYHDVTNNDLKFALCDLSASTNLKCDQTADWTTSTVDASGLVGRFSSIALDSSGSPVISYQDATNANLKFATAAFSSGTFTVNTTDDIDDGNCNAVHCSLREAINAANASVGTDTIEFDITGGGPHTIAPTSALPSITDPVIIDGYTQPGASANTNPISAGSNAVLKIVLDGTSAGTPGLHITAGGSTVKGLVINNFSTDGILIDTNGNNVIEGNYIGTNVAGTAAAANLRGVAIQNVPNNRIGGATASQRNVISGNTAQGILIQSPSATGNDVQGNYIGTNAAGNAAIPNGVDGVRIGNGADSNTIGGIVAGAGNIISGNVGDGIEINSTATNLTRIEGNFIGTNAAGTAGIGNTGNGVFIDNAGNNMIGGNTSAQRNVISGNGSWGVFISGGTATGNEVQGNFIGTNAAGAAPLGNGFSGVIIYDGASNNEVGGITATPGTPPGNVISGNDRAGVNIQDLLTDFNVVEGNLIGTNAAGNGAVANALDGVLIIDSPNNTIGGAAAGARNVISGNTEGGVEIRGASATGNKVEGNFIGTDITGLVDLGNTLDGVFIDGAPGNFIGAAAATSGAPPGNVISGNNSDGVQIDGTGATGNEVQGNLIGTDVTGLVDLGNSLNGVFISGAPSNTIGGTASGARNVISGNDDDSGVEINGTSATGNVVEGNFIGTDISGTVAVGNSRNGVLIFNAPSNTVGGTTSAARNVISGNGNRGIMIARTGSLGNTVQGNFIGTQVDGTSPLGNAYYGVAFGTFASNSMVGGLATGASNTIAFNGDYGVYIGSGSDNAVRGNSIYSHAIKGIRLISGANGDIPPPPIDSVSSASGRTDPKCYPCTVDVFSDDDDEGRIYHGSTATNNDATGTWTYSGTVTGPNITATVTDAAGNTSEFSLYDTDGDGVGNGTDVCPNDANNDVDNDGICVGSGFLSPKTGDNDNCPTTANPGQENQDGDQWGDDCETPECIAVATAWVTPPDDTDCDGWTTADENFIGTNPNDDCGTGAWPPDFDDNQIVDIFDVSAMAPPVFFSTAPGPPYSSRLDLTAGSTPGDPIIDIFDVSALGPPLFFATCTP